MTVPAKELQTMLSTYMQNKYQALIKNDTDIADAVNKAKQAILATQNQFKIEEFAVPNHLLVEQKFNVNVEQNKKATQIV